MGDLLHRGGLGHENQRQHTLSGRQRPLLLRRAPWDLRPLQGRDLSGQPIMAITPEIAKEAQQMGAPLECEQPRCGRKPSLLIVPA